MKTYNEMAQSALSRISEHEAEKKKRRRLAVPAAALCLAAVLGIGAWQSGLFGAESPIEDVVVPTSAPTVTPTQTPEVKIITGDPDGQKGTDITEGCCLFRWTGLTIGGALIVAIDDNPDGTFAVIASYRPTTGNITSFVYEGKTLAELAIAAYEENAPQEAMKDYKLAYNAYLETAMPEAMRLLSDAGISCERTPYTNNGLKLTVSTQELKSLPKEFYSDWVFDLAPGDTK